MPKQPLGLLSIGVFALIVAISIIVAVQFKLNLGASLALIVAFSGGWTIALAGIRFKNPEKYVRGAFSLLGWGVLIVAVGGAWFIYSLESTHWLYSVLLLLTVVGILAVVAALRGFRK